MLLLALAAACSGGGELDCAQRADDADCDGVPDAADRCPNTAADQLTDRLGCSGTQAAGCSARLVAPEDGARPEGAALFRWESDCDISLLQFSDDPSFPAGATTTAARTHGIEAVVEAAGAYWRVQAGLHGSTAPAPPPHPEQK